MNLKPVNTKPALLPCAAIPLVNSEYPVVTKYYIDAATSTIDLCFFAAKYYSGLSHNFVNAFFNSLRKAANRGVAIRLLLNSNFNSGDFLQNNIFIAKHFRSGNFDAALSGKSTRLHSKLIIIDKQITILGSHNQSVRAFSRNFETSIVIKSPAIATIFTNHFSRLWRSRQIITRSPA